MINKVVQIPLSGGVIGSMLTHPSKALENCIREENRLGWKATHFAYHRENNLIMKVGRYVTLALTVGLWTWEPGYVVLFERVSLTQNKDSSSSNSSKMAPPRVSSARTRISSSKATPPSLRRP